MSFIVDIVKMILEMLHDWPIGTVVGVLMLLVVLLLLGLLTWGCFIALDSWFLPRKSDTGKIVRKTFTPAYTEIILMYNAATKTSMPCPIFHPDDWSVTVEVAECQDSLSVDEDEFDILREEDNVLAEYVTGRISSGLYLKSITRM
jgi:hypothetical protein